MHIKFHLHYNPQIPVHPQYLPDYNLPLNNDRLFLKLSDYSYFRRTVKAGFAQRRKNIKNCLLNGGFLRENVVKALETIGVDENTRGEKLSIETLGKLSEALLASEEK